jgi:hypothetical protein
MANARFADRYSLTVEAVTQSERSVQAGKAFLMSSDSIRISVTDAENFGSQWEAVVLPPSQFGTIVTVERIGRDSIVVKRCDGDHGFCGKSIKLFFDLESKKVLGRVEFLPLGVSQFVVKNDAFYSVSEDHDYIIARYDSGPPRLVAGAEKNAVLTILPVPEPPKYRPNRRSFLKSGPLDPSLNPDVQPDDYVEIPPKSGFWLSRGAGVQQIGVEGVVERSPDGYYLYAMPQSTPDEVFQRRPKLRGRIIEQSQIQEQIGAYAFAGDRLWFGRTFYDGEGIVGVGTLGYFDLKQRMYRLFSLQALADWSTSAMLAEEDAVWAGMVHRPEGATYSGGLLRFEPSTGRTQVYRVDDVIYRIERWRDALYIGTNNGVYVIRGGQTAGRYVFEPALGGAFEIIAVNQ